MENRMKAIVLSAFCAMLLVSSARADEGFLVPEVFIKVGTSTWTGTSTGVAWVTSPAWVFGDPPILRVEPISQNHDFWTLLFFYAVGVGATAIPFVIANGLRRRHLRRLRGCAECGSDFHGTDDHLLAKLEVERLVQS